VPRAHELPSERVTADLRARIAAREWQPGEALPTVSELAASYGVSRATVAKAVRVLVDDGLLVTRARWGTFLRPE
jgi:GntR family transcriptional regulator